MKVAVVTGRRHIEIREIPTPQVQPSTVLLKVKLCAICGTDLVFADDPRLDNYKEGKNKFEAVLGHEWVGEVVEIGPGGGLVNRRPCRRFSGQLRAMLLVSAGSASPLYRGQGKYCGFRRRHPDIDERRDGRVYHPVPAKC